MDAPTMHQTLVLAARILLGVFVGMNLLVIARKAWRERRERIERERRTELEPLVLAFAHGHGLSIRDALGDVAKPSDGWVLERVLLDALERVTGVERERLGRALDELGLVDGYLERLTHPHWWRRAEAAERVGLARVRRAQPALRSLLLDESPEVRMRAAKALGRIGDPSSLRSLIEALQQPNRWSTIRVADVLAEAGRDVVDELVAAFDDLAPPAKLAALDILGRLREIHATGWIRGRLRDEDPDVRARACHALGAIGDPESGPDLVDALEDPAWPVRAMAAKAIGRVRYEAAVPALCNTIRDREWWVRSNAAGALRQLGRKGTAALELMVDDDDPYAGQQAVLRLEEAGMVEEQVEALARPPGKERRIAEAFLGRIVEAGQTGRVREIAGRHADPKVREALGRLLREREGRS